MSIHLDESAIDIRYLLGELSAAEAQSFEHSFFADERVFEDLKASESEVIDAYVSNQLTNKHRQHFQARVALSPRLQERVAFARAFAQSTAAGDPTSDQVSDSPAARESWWKRVFTVPVFGPLSPAGAFATVLLLVSITVVTMQSFRLRNESQRLAGERVALEHQRDELARLATEERNRTASELRDAQARAERAEELVRSLQQREGESQPPKQQSIFASITLLPGSLRSGGATNKLTLPPGARQIHIQLVLLRTDYRSYQVTIKDPASNPINRANLRPGRDKTLVLRLPASSFPPGQYTVQVSGVSAGGNVEFVSDYAFRVSKE